MKKISLKVLAYKTIKERIISCEYRPGSFLSEELLTEELQISRTPIRDALSRLEQEGLVEIKSKKGITVTPLSFKDINMIFELRSLYEPYILKNYSSLIPEEKLHEFYLIFQNKKADNECFQNNNYFYELDTAFHQLIVDACPNTYIRQNYALIQTQSERFRFMTGNVSNNRLEDTFKEHLEIITFCLQKDWEQAARQLLYHLEQSKKAAFQLVFDSAGSHDISI